AVVFVFFGFSNFLWAGLEEPEFSGLQHKKAQHAPFSSDQTVEYKDLEDLLFPFLLEEVLYDYAYDLKLMFNLHKFQEKDPTKRFGSPLHPNETIVSGWNCLYKKVLENKNNKKEQKQVLFDLLALHKTEIRFIDEELFKEIQQHAPCQNCINRIKKEFI
ncbi:MAG TPA: hypothetical protein VI959_03800, partial [Alphaproteobacteria bacterium]|nr:hypothetical protein [Alphaproteobacteria bacterium]